MSGSNQFLASLDCHREVTSDHLPFQHRAQHLPTLDRSFMDHQSFWVNYHSLT